MLDQVAESRIYAAGLNAHGQLDHTSRDDLKHFRRLPAVSDEPAHWPFFSGWSQTVYRTQTTLLCNGFGNRIIRFNAQGSDFVSSFGDHNGMLGALGKMGCVYVLEISPERSNTASSDLVSLSTDGPHVGHLALAGNGRVAITFIQAPNSQLTHIVEFITFSAFKAWYINPADERNYPVKHHMVPGRVQQLVANATAFICLMDAGGVYTWGDARFRNLGRRSTALGDEHVVPAAEPGIVEALGGIKITKISAGGWVMGALSEDGAAYIWGARTPGTEKSIRPLTTVEGDGVVLVEIQEPADSDPFDVVDLTIGNGHAVVLCEGGKVFGIGENRYGQLGCGTRQDFYESWVKVIRNGALSAEAGPKCTFVRVRASEPSSIELEDE